MKAILYRQMIQRPCAAFNGEDAVGAAQGVAIGDWSVNLEITMCSFVTCHVPEAPPINRPTELFTLSLLALRG